MLRRLTLSLALLLPACTQEMGEGVRQNEQTTPAAADPIAPYAECRVTTWDAPAASAMHVEPCSELPLSDVPPVGGDHYGVWADWASYDAPVPWGFLIHAMEHGGVVLGYRCPEGCDDVIAELEAIAASMDDPRCRDAGTSARFIVAPMPDLEGSVAALGWEHAYVATCLDAPSLGAWVDAHYGRGPEDLCAAGSDLSAEGWCP